MKKTTNLLPSWNTFRTFLLITTLFTTGLFYSCKKTDTASSTPTPAPTPTPTSGYKSSGKIKFSPVAGLFNSGIGLREFFLTVMVEDITKETTVDFIVSANKNPEKWTTVKDLPAKYSRAFEQGVPREIYFSATDKYDDTKDKNFVVGVSPARRFVTDLTKGEKNPPGFMIPGQTYYVHAYISGSYTNSSQPITLQNYPDKNQLPKQISKQNPVWAADVKPGKTYDPNDPNTYFHKTIDKNTRKDAVVIIGSINAYLWGTDFWRNTDGSFREIKLRLDEVNFIPLRLIRPFESSMPQKDIDALGICAAGTTTNKPVFQVSPDTMVLFGDILTWDIMSMASVGGDLNSRTTLAWFYNYSGLGPENIGDGLFLINKYNYNQFYDLDSKTYKPIIRGGKGVKFPIRYQFELDCFSGLFVQIVGRSSLKIYVIEK